MNIDFRKELKKALDLVSGQPFRNEENFINAYWEICCGCVLVAEEDLKEQRNVWEIAGLSRTLLHHIEALKSVEGLEEKLLAALSRMESALYDHPRLKLKLLNSQKEILARNEKANSPELKELESRINLLENNISAADKGEFSKIIINGSLKRDPVEFTAKWEEVIDEVDRKVYASLEDFPRGMGFCHAFWPARANRLRKYGIEWKSPRQMNPRVIFD